MALDWLTVAKRQDDVDAFLRTNRPDLDHGERWRAARRLAIGDERIAESRRRRASQAMIQLTASALTFNEAVAQITAAMKPIAAEMARALVLMLAANARERSSRRRWWQLWR